MEIKVLGSDIRLTAISFVNGVLVGIDETVDEMDVDADFEESEKDDGKQKKKPKKNPEDNLGDAVGFLDTAKIERGVDFLAIKEEINILREKNGWTMADFFKNDNAVANFCEHYEYTLPNFIRLMVEHMPEEVDLKFIRSTIKPTIAALQKLKSEYQQNGQQSGQTVGYRRIFAFI